MLKKILFVLLIFFTALVQVSFLGVFLSAWMAPSLLLIIVLTLVYQHHVKESYFCAFCGGFFLDWLTLSSWLGLSSIFFLLTVLLWQGMRKITAARRPAFISFIFTASFLNGALFSYPWTYPWLKPVLWAAGGSVLTAVLLLPLLSAIFRYLFEEDDWQLDFRSRL